MDELFALIDNNDVISFDMFDTLVKRFVYSPKDLFYVVEREFNEKFATSKSFHDDRVSAEKRLYIEEGADQTTIDEIYDSLSRYGYTDDERKFLMDAELRAERKYIKVLDSGKQYYDYATSRGKIVILTSDMYLSEEFLGSVMHSLGYDFDAVYVSGDEKMSKSGGKIFEFLLDKYAGKKILHIGDNVKSDYLMPIKYGLSAYHLARHKNCPPISDPVVRSIAEHSGDDILYDFGYSYYGPLLTGFARFIKDKLSDSDAILFLSRDGYIVKQVYDKLFPSEKTEYFYASRRALINPSVSGEFEEIIGVLLLGSRASWYEFLSKTNLLSKSTEKALSTAGFELKKEYPISEFSQNAEFKSFYNSFLRPIFERNKQEQTALLTRYFADVTHGGAKVGVVDIGWFGNMQSALERLFPDVAFKGAYLGMLSKSENKLGYAFDRKGETKNFLIEHFYNAFTELLFSAPHGSVVKYEDVGGEVRPVCDGESVIQDKIARIQSGALDFVSEFAPYSSDAHDFNADFFFDNYYDFSAEFLREISSLDFSDYGSKKLIEIAKGGVSKRTAVSRSFCKIGAIRLNYGVNPSRLFAFLYRLKIRRKLK